MRTIEQLLPRRAQGRWSRNATGVANRTRQACKPVGPAAGAAVGIAHRSTGSESAGRARTDGMITHRFALERYGDALEAVRGDSSAHKVVITL